MKKLLLLTISLLFYGFCMAQNASIKGAVTDTINKLNLQNTVVSVLSAKDSTLVKFVRTNAKGFFELKNLKAGNYLLLATYPEYADYAEQLTLTDSSAVNSDIKLLLKANLLKEVIVKQQINAIRMKGDTTEFAADSFKVQPNATVEDLLKKLPGIQVDKNGKITAQGETVQKVLVDGEEFFGDDPTLVTQNLHADMVDKVQVYDKKSDQAAFTGIDDGQKQKTINLKLKDNKKNGYFGKVDAGAGTNGYFDNQAMFNLFKNKEKFAAYGIVSNTGKTGLNWQDQSNYGDNWLASADYDETNGFIGNSFNDDLDWNGQYNGQGYPLVQTGGLHFNNKWDDDKQGINANYKIMNLGITGTSTTNSNSILGNDSVNYTNDYQTFKNTVLRNKGNATYDLQFDSSSSLKVLAGAGVDHKTTSTFDSSQSLTNSNLVNNSLRTLNSQGDDKTMTATILWRKKFKKKGRTLSLNVTENYSDKSSAGYLYSTIDTFANNQFAGAQITDQYKTYWNRNNSIDSKLTYSEPLTKVSSIVLNYGIVINNSNSIVNSYNKDPEGKYKLLDTTYSDDYKFNVFTQRGGAAYSLVKKKLRFSIGSNVGVSGYNQTNVINDSSTSRHFVDWYPQTNFSYSFTPQERVGFYYSGNTRQPSIQQLQPVVTNDDPLNVNIGNPYLKPEFSNRMRLYFSNYKELSQSYFSTGVSYNFIENDISTSSDVDASGKRTNQSVNLNGTRSLSAYFNLTYKIKKIDTYLSFNGNFDPARNVNIVNNELNVTNSVNYTGGISLSKQKENKYSIDLSGNATYTSSTSSIQDAVKTNYWTYEIQPNFNIYLPLKFQIHGEGDFKITEKTPAYNTNTDIFLINAWIGKKLLKDGTLLVKVTCNDLLNQNIGFTRNVESNFTTQNTYSAIGRYLLLSAVWNFTKAGSKAPTQNF